MPVVFVPAQLRDLTGGVSEVAVVAATVGEAVDALEARFPEIRGRLRRESALTPGIYVSVDDVMTRRGLSAPLRPESEVHFLPAIGGG